MADINDLVAKAKDELGYLEKSRANYDLYGANCLYHKTKYAGADNYTKYAYELRAAGLGHPNGQPWCQSFVNWLFYKTFGADLANQLLCGKLSSASTMEVKDAFVRSGRQVASVEPGDIAFRARSGGGHVGLVIGYANGKAITIEGNSSSTDITSWNGGAVVKHTGAPWTWYVRPDWSLIRPKEEVWKWIQSGGKWYYQNRDGKNLHGWAKIKESAGPYFHWYWFDKTGAAATGGVQIDGKWYFFMPEGEFEGAECLTTSTGALTVWSMTE